jgi:uncharacterized protein
MATEEDRTIDLLDETRLNVASLLMEPVGNMRDVHVELAALPLDESLVAERISVLARLTRLKDGILVVGDVRATVPLECATCLAEYDQQISERFSESFRQLVDVRTGMALPADSADEDEDVDDEPAFSIDESHELDLGEAIRQWILLALPMQPSCGPDCPGPLLHSTSEEESADNRFASLASLLDDDEPTQEPR